MTLNFATGNNLKFQVASNIFENMGIDLIQQTLDIPEIQSTDVEEIANYSAKIACNLLNEPTMVTDVGYYITALNCFPATFVKYTNNWLGAKGIIKLMEGELNREVVIRECASICIPGTQPVSFVSYTNGTIAISLGGSGSAMDQVFIPENWDIVIGLASKEKQIEYWQQNLDHYSNLGKYYIDLISK
jgi:non-canonical purine NTP pyrophosphatase (RdgB/HAM1 family)